MAPPPPNRSDPPQTSQSSQGRGRAATGGPTPRPGPKQVGGVAPSGATPGTGRPGVFGRGQKGPGGAPSAAAPSPAKAPTPQASPRPGDRTRPEHSRVGPESLAARTEALSIAGGAASASTDVGSQSSGSSGGRSSVGGRGTARGSNRSRDKYIFRSRPQGLGDKKGSTGNDINILTNYFPVMKKQGSKLEQWRVDFSPEEDHMATRKTIIRSLETQLGNHLFDGTVIYTMHSIGAGQLQLTFTVQKPQGGISRVDMRLVGEVLPSETRYVAIFNLILRKCLQHLKLQLVGREYYDSDPSVRITIPKHNLELWPGYVTSIRQHEKQILLCVDTKFKIVRRDTALIAMKQAMTGGNRDAADKAVLGQIVMTSYNNRTYNVEAIEWKKSPSDTFPSLNGMPESYVNYYRRKYSKNIGDLRQPLLLAKPRERSFRRNEDASGQSVIYLVPELCVMTGLTERQRADFRLMSDVAQYTRTTPPTRIQALKNFSQRFAGTKTVEKELRNWNLKFGSELQSVRGRSIPPQEIVQGNNMRSTYRIDNSDWGNTFRNAKLFGPARCGKWAVVSFNKDHARITSFVKQVMQMGDGMAFPIDQPKYFQVPDNNNAAFAETVQKVARMGPQMVMAVTPNNKSTSYATVKKICCVEHGVPSQVITASILNKDKGLASIATKVTVQMAAKLGGEPWNVKIPMGGLMIMGYDSFHDTQSKKKSVGALISTTNANLTRFYSTVSVHENNEELLVNMRSGFRKAIDAYRKVQGQHPKFIIVYRDGVGEGQIEAVFNAEVSEIQKVLLSLGAPEKPKLTFIIVSKRINSRFFVNVTPQPVNPPSGAIIDDVVTLPERYDFYLISQSVRQGTVNPTYYNVILDEMGIPPDRLQLITYRQCHMYYNWPGTIKVPAVCQYAHKLANLVGEHLHQTPNERLAGLLYYL